MTSFGADQLTSAGQQVDLRLRAFQGPSGGGPRWGMADNSSPRGLGPCEAGTQRHPLLEVIMRAMVHRGPNRLRGEDKNHRRTMGRRKST
jgi:hypothetical protein